MLLTTMLRIVVPALWGGFISWAIGIVPALAPVQAHLLGLSDVILPVITALIIGAWVAFWHWLQPRLPDWVVRALLGSAKTPLYVGKHSAAATPVNFAINANTNATPENVAKAFAKDAQYRLNR